MDFNLDYLSLWIEPKIDFRKFSMFLSNSHLIVHLNSNKINKPGFYDCCVCMNKRFAFKSPKTESEANSLRIPSQYSSMHASYCRIVILVAYDSQ